MKAPKNAAEERDVAQPMDSPHGTDDRGRPLAPETAPAKPPWKQWTPRESVSWLAPIVLLSVTQVLVLRLGSFGPANAVIVGSIFFSIWSYWRGPRKQGKKWQKGLHGEDAWRVAHGVCPQCEYKIGDLPATEDGCVVCPECGLAWHRHRFTLLGSDIDARGPLLSQPGETFGDQTRADDRNVRLLRPVKWPAEWARGAGTGGRRGSEISSSPAENGPEGASVAGIERVLAFEDRKQRFVLTCAIVLPPPLVAAFAAVVVDARDRYEAVMLGLVAGVITAVSLAWHMRRSRPVKNAILVFKLCPNCGGKLSGEPQFDGCTACAGCGRAWKV